MKEEQYLYLNRKREKLDKKKELKEIKNQIID